MSKSTTKSRDWYKKRCDEGCQICGAKFPGRKNNGMIMSHIIDSGSNIKENLLALCSNCEKSFDEIIKPAIYKAIMIHNNGKIPEEWKGAKDSVQSDIPTRALSRESMSHRRER
jgi:5-methylcytosine-specific restriction endonuclease McrA